MGVCRLKRQSKVRVRHPQPWLIPLKATKNLNSLVVGLFSFMSYIDLNDLEDH